MEDKETKADIPDSTLAAIGFFVVLCGAMFTLAFLMGSGLSLAFHLFT